MKRINTFLTLFVLMLLSTALSYSTIRYVGASETFTTIQAAVTASGGNDTIYVKDDKVYEENVNIPGGKNGLYIANFAGDTPVLDGTTVANPKVAFRINSDNVTITGFTIQNYVYTGNTNVAYLQPNRGVAIEMALASSQHTVYNNIIINCNWGIFSREGNNIEVYDNTITDIVRSTYAGTWYQQGGVGITFLSGGNAMDGNKIHDNSLDFAGDNPNYGIFYGRADGAGSCGADVVSIYDNTVKNATVSPFFAYAVYNIKMGESIIVENNISDNNYAAMDIGNYIATDNTDLTVRNNQFINTVSVTEVRTSDLFSGAKLWEILTTNGNVYSNSTDLSNGIVSLYYTDDSVTSDGTHRYIRNDLDAAVTDAEGYLGGLGGTTQGRVWVQNGTYVLDNVAHVNLTIPTDELLITGESMNAILTDGLANPLINITSGVVEVTSLTFKMNATNNGLAISTEAENTYIHDNNFTSFNTGSYQGIMISDGGDAAQVKNNNFDGSISIAIAIESENPGNPSVIECNTFDATEYSAGSSLIVMADLLLGGDIDNIEVISNTFKGTYDNAIVIVTTAGTSNVKIGKAGAGNTFEGLGDGAILPNAINITQVADYQVAINYNAFLDYAPLFYRWIQNDNANRVNARFNYWAVSDTTDYPDEIDYMIEYPNFVDYLPIFTKATDTDTTCGFQVDLTSVWVPVYTAVNDGDDVFEPTNEYFFTIEAALADVNTTSGDREFIYPYLSQVYPEATTANPLIFNSADLTLAAAPAQMANGNVRPTVEISNSFAGPILAVDFNTTTIDSITFISGTDPTYYPIVVNLVSVDGLTVKNSTFDVSDATAPDAAIMFQGNGDRTNINFIKNNFTVDNGNVAINFEVTDPTITNTNVKVEYNNIVFGGNAATDGILFGHLDNASIKHNAFGTGIKLYTGDVNTGLDAANLVNISCNIFKPATTSSGIAIDFLPNGAGNYNYISIQQNLIEQFLTGISFATLNNAQVSDFANFSVNYNNFQNIGNNGIDMGALNPANKLNAKDNYWQSNYGPWSFEQAPAWHDNVGNLISSNAYGYLFNSTAAYTVPLQDATYIQFVPWWQDIQDSVCAYTGTSFAPINNDDGGFPGEVYASLIFAVEGTNDAGNIYMKYVPNFPGSGITSDTVAYYMEENTIENADKSLSIWGDPFYLPTTKIAVFNTDANEVMVRLEGTAPRTVDFNFLGFTYDPIAAADINYGIQYNTNVSGTIDWCYFDGIQETDGNQYLAVVYLTDNTNTVNVNNSLFKNNYGVLETLNIYADNQSTLNMDNTEIHGLGSSSTLTNSYEIGVIIKDGANLTMKNSSIWDMQIGTAGSSGLFLINDVNPTGTIKVYQNIFAKNSVAINAGFGYANDDFTNAQIYDNVFLENTYGLQHNPGVVSTITVKDNFWGSNNGPRSENQVGGTQENTYNEIAQGNEIKDMNAFSTIDYLPWRRAVMAGAMLDTLATKIAGPRFAPIVRTNPANIAVELYANFTDAEADLVANQKLYAYSGDYSETFKVDVSNTQIIGKYQTTPYSVGWILGPNAPQFLNAWTTTPGQQGAVAQAPKIISDGSANNYLVATGPNNLTDFTMQGFIFDTKAKATPTDPYTGNPTIGFLSTVITDRINILHNTFEGDVNDKGIEIGTGGVNHWIIGYNKYNGTTPGRFVNAISAATIQNVSITSNEVINGTIYMQNGAGVFENTLINLNEFKNTLGAIVLDGSVQAGRFDSLLIKNNKFYEDNTFSFLVTSGTNDNVVLGSWYKDVIFTNNWLAIPAGNIAVGFQNPLALTVYSDEIQALCNWWNGVGGLPTGPTYAYNPGGTGSQVSDMVYFTPWLSSEANTATFGFVPAATTTCDQGIRVWSNNTGDPATQTHVFPSIQLALMYSAVKSGAEPYVYVDDVYAQNAPENVSVNLNAGTSIYLANEIDSLPINLDGSLQIAGTNLWNMMLNSPFNVSTDLILDNSGALGYIWINKYDLTVDGNITEAAYGPIVTVDGGTGYLVKNNVITGGINRFPLSWALGPYPIGVSGTATPAEFVVNAAGFDLAQQNQIKVRVTNADPVAYKGMGEDGYDVNNIWSIDFVNNAGTNPYMAMQLRYLNLALNDPNYVNISSYGAYWDMDPVATQWTTKKSTSSWNGTDGVQINNLNLESSKTDWAIFSGSTSFALSDAPAQAKNIQWTNASDVSLEFQWQRNGLDNQYYAILAIEGSPTTPPAAFNPSPSCAVTPNGPWSCGPGQWNFSDGYVDNVTGAIDWTTKLFHNGASLPENVKVLKVGQYGLGTLTETALVEGLDQGTYYTFFVANFNYGDGTTNVPDMITGEDGMANYNQNPNILNPRTRKTTPAVYLTIDISQTFGANNTPSIVYGKTPTTIYSDMNTTANHWRVNGTLTGNTVVRNQYNNDALIGGHFAELCNPTNFSPNNVTLHFRGYGNNGGLNWAIKYSENNITWTHTTPFASSNAIRTRNIATKYYLVSAYDGDGKYAKLYDNTQNVALLFDEPTTVSGTTIVGTMPTCEGNSVTLTSSASSLPPALFNGWEVSVDSGTTWEPISTTNIVSTFTMSGNDLVLDPLDYDDNGKLLRVAYNSTSVCDYPDLGKLYYTIPAKLEIYDATLTGLKPEPNDPFICSDQTTITFTANDGGPHPSPNNLVLQGWYISSDGGTTWSALSPATYGAITTITYATNTITLSDADLLDNYAVKAEWKNGDCAVTETEQSLINVITKPTISTQPTTPAPVCINQDITVATDGTPYTSIRWEMGATNAGPWTVLNDGISPSGEIVDATTTTITLTPANMDWDLQWIRAVYVNSEGGTDCETPTDAVEIDILPTPVFEPIADQTVCETTNFTTTAVDANPVSWSGNILWYYNSTPTMTGATQMTSGNTYHGSTVTFSGASDATININSIAAAWNNVYVIAYNSNGSCDGFEPFMITIDTLPVLTNEQVLPAAACAGPAGVLTYSFDYTPESMGNTNIQWFYNGNLITNGVSLAGDPTQNIPNANALNGHATLVVTNITTALDASMVFARVTNGVCNYVQSNTMLASVDSIPLAPSTIGAQNIRAKKFDVTWDPISNATSYDIEIDDNADFSSPEVLQNVLAPAIAWTGMADCQLLDGQTYYFRVRAKNACGDGDWKQSNMVTLDPTVVSINWTVGDGIFGSSVLGTPTAPEVFTITYYQLDAGLNVNVSNEYEIRPAGATTWMNGNVDLTPYLTMYLGTAATPLKLDIATRFRPITCGAHNVDFIHTSNEICVGTTNFIENQVNPGVNDDATGTGIIAAPTLNASNIVVFEPTTNEFNVTWTNGGGTDRLVIITTAPTIAGWTPQSNTPYTPNSNSITDPLNVLAPNVWLVGNTNGTSQTVTGLTSGVVYYAHIWEYSQCGPNTQQYDNDYSSNQAYYLVFHSAEPTPAIPDQVSGVSSTKSDGTTPLDVYLTLTQRNGNLINAPANLNLTIDRDPNTGTFTTTNAVVINAGTNTSNTFNFTWTDICGVQDGNLTASNPSVNTGISNDFDLKVTVPTSQARIITWVGIPCAASTTFKWTNGNGAGRLVVAREGALPANPADNQTYNPNSDWASRSASNHLSDSTYALGAINNTDLLNNQITITNLEINKTYYFRVYEYNGCVPTTRRYNTTNATFNPRSRTITCKDGNDLNDIIIENFDVKSNKGTGIINFNTLFEANMAGFEIRRYNITDEEMSGVLVGSYMNNPELIAEGNTITGKHYSFTDNSIMLEVGKTYLYQLTAIGFDGKSYDVVEKEITISNDVLPGLTEFSVSPVTQTSNEAKFVVTVSKSNNVTISLFDLAGNKISTILNNAIVNRGSHDYKVNTSNLTNGTYVIVVEADNNTAIQKFQIVR